MNNPGDIATLQQLTDILDKLDITYAVGGSMASSIYGKVRFTADADISVSLFEKKIDQFYDLLKKDFYVSKQAIIQSLTGRTSFNVIHLKSAFKIDIFILRDDVFESKLLLRSKHIKLSDSVDKLFSVVSPEDIILLKLRWYRDSGCVSDRQFSDVVNVLAVQKQNLDFDYLNTWALKLQLSDLLKKAIDESKI
ncbi:MAG: hypothetical protein ACYTBP_09105 [Planctomycetota bacterium]